ncbi:phosphopentomutase [Fructilactobacillus myrtifloralis]|uniref:Phosphopentomutase n=1 Tax=Fructilactobacillus myrtifloralis TaxID=2940301 RepID=A0ABY5BP16_9LACO|nr:phosphopentomutase [Fructilactobacillus myrtifloralis]USS84832.1 phosphopentomutase [Fructilactobacillus myrtifloralis]
MSYKRVILVDLAALGLRSDNESAQHNSDNDTLLTHVLNQSAESALPTFHKLGLFNVYFDSDEESDNPPIATYGLTRTRSIVNKACSGLREMFDCALSYRVSSVFEEVGKRTNSITISRFVSYLFSQEHSRHIQVGNDQDAFAVLKHQLEKNQAGFFYLQVPSLQTYAQENEFEDFTDALNDVDQYLNQVMEQLHDDDLLMVVSSRVGDNRSKDGFSTYKILPFMLYNQNLKAEHLLDKPFVCEVGGTVLAALGLQQDVISPKHNLLPNSEVIVD